MLDYSQIEQYDPSGMHKIYDRWPEIARSAYESDLEPVDFHNIDHIVFAGMGGSGAIGNLFESILSKTDIHVSLVNGYLLPKTVDKNTLVITTSISGNTSETLNVLETAKNLDCKLIAFFSGGKMEEYCNKTQTDFRKIESIHSPRSSFVKFTYSILKILNHVLPIERKEILESLVELETMKKQIASNNLSNSNPAIDLASWISGIPLIYYPHGLQSTAIRFKQSLQENAKIHAMIEDIVEASHNGIVSWEKPSIVQPILLQGHDDYIKTKERWQIIKEYFAENNINFKEIHSTSGNILTKIISLVYLFDYTSIYKAILSKTDPTPVSSIAYIKDRI
jgi:glucose/mannose-6-phosphate isomerase